MDLLMYLLSSSVRSVIDSYGVVMGGARAAAFIAIFVFAHGFAVIGIARLIGFIPPKTVKHWAAPVLILSLFEALALAVLNTLYRNEDIYPEDYLWIGLAPAVIFFIILWVIAAGKPVSKKLKAAGYSRENLLTFVLSAASIACFVSALMLLDWLLK